jgi:putative transposase
VYGYPLTIADQHTRFLLACHGLLWTETATARPVFERAFREYRVPAAIRTDNGVPFATLAVHGLSYLNVWWMRLGIVHQRIHPGCPPYLSGRSMRVKLSGGSYGASAYDAATQVSDVGRSCFACPSRNPTYTFSTK